MPDVEKMIQDFMEKGGAITVLPSGVAEGAGELARWSMNRYGNGYGSRQECMAKALAAAKMKAKKRRKWKSIRRP